jgi:TonB family protein
VRFPALKLAQPVSSEENCASMLRRAFWLMRLFPTSRATGRLITAKKPRSEFWARCTDGTPAEVTHHEPPHYPDNSKMHREEGRVATYLRIETDGTVSHLHVLSAPSPDLAQAAIDALAQFRFTPATCAGMPIRTEGVSGAVFQMRP